MESLREMAGDPARDCFSCWLGRASRGPSRAAGGPGRGWLSLRAGQLSTPRLKDGNGHTWQAHIKHLRCVRLCAGLQKLLKAIPALEEHRPVPGEGMCAKQLASVGLLKETALG